MQIDWAKINDAVLVRLFLAVMTSAWFNMHTQAEAEKEAQRPGARPWGD